MLDQFDYETAKANYVKAGQRADKFPDNEDIRLDETLAWEHYIRCAQLSLHCIRWNCDEKVHPGSSYCLTHQPPPTK